jgi:heparosan-N-sulfate-glucuronate 5-epimerase
MWFPETAGNQFRPGEVRGYYVELREAAKTSDWPQPWLETRKLPVGICQWGLGSYERYLAGDGSRWLDAAVAAGDHLLAHQQRGGPLDGGWVHDFAYPHTYKLPPPWLSGITQGQAASLLVRLHLSTKDDRYAVGARKAVRSLSLPTVEGGLLAPLGGGMFPEEFPTDPPSLVLNGGLYALLGQYDVAVGLDDADARARFAEGSETAARNLHRWDTGHWSRYDLYPHRISHVASPWYHRLHIAQLDVFHRLTGRSEFRDRAIFFERYAASRANRTRAFAQKALFRMFNPRRGTRLRRS